MNYAAELRAILVDGGWDEEKAAVFVAECLDEIDRYVEGWIQAVRESGR